MTKHGSGKYDDDEASTIVGLALGRLLHGYSAYQDAGTDLLERFQRLLKKFGVTTDVQGGLLFIWDNTANAEQARRTNRAQRGWWMRYRAGHDGIYVLTCPQGAALPDADDDDEPTGFVSREQQAGQEERLPLELDWGARAFVGPEVGSTRRPPLAVLAEALVARLPKELEFTVK